MIDPEARYDTVVVGGGVMGSTVAFRLARAGQRVALLERGGLCMQASGVNAGTLSIQIKRAALVPYAMKGWDLWRTTKEWLGAECGFRQVGGLTLAFTDEEAEMLTSRMEQRSRNGAPVEMIELKRARAIEPGLSEKPLLASWCPMDGYANSNQLGDIFRGALRAAGVEIHEFTRVNRIDRPGRGYVAHGPDRLFESRRVVLAGGVWLEELLARDFGILIPITCRVNQVSVTERMPPIINTVLGIATSLLTLKQSANGTILIGGGWQGRGDPQRGGYEILPENLVGNLRLSAYVVPALRKARVVRTWLGVEGNAPDVMPLVGDVPGAPDAYVIGCVRGGYTIGPYMGMLLAQHILGKEPEMPLFDPARFIVPNDAATSRAETDRMPV